VGELGRESGRRHGGRAPITASSSVRTR
jgi:hypothetical protein